MKVFKKNTPPHTPPKHTHPSFICPNMTKGSNGQLLCSLVIREKLNFQAILIELDQVQLFLFRLRSISKTKTKTKTKTKNKKTNQVSSIAIVHGPIPITFFVTRPWNSIRCYSNSHPPAKDLSSDAEPLNKK